MTQLPISNPNASRRTRELGCGLNIAGVDQLLRWLSLLITEFLAIRDECAQDRGDALFVASSASGGKGEHLSEYIKLCISGRPEAAENARH